MNSSSSTFFASASGSGSDSQFSSRILPCRNRKREQWLLVLLCLAVTMSDGYSQSSVEAAPFPSPNSGQSETLRIPLIKPDKDNLQQKNEQLEEVNLNEDCEDTEGGQGEIKNSKYVPVEPLLPPGEIRQYKIRPDSLDLSSLSISSSNTPTQGDNISGDETDANASELQLSGDGK